jgi:hypothetical protein
VFHGRIHHETIQFSPHNPRYVIPQAHPHCAINHFQSARLISPLPTRHYHLHLLPTTLRLIRVHKYLSPTRFFVSYLRKTASVLIQRKQIMEKMVKILNLVKHLAEYLCTLFSGFTIRRIYVCLTSLLAPMPLASRRTFQRPTGRKAGEALTRMRFPSSRPSGTQLQSCAEL